MGHHCPAGKVEALVGLLAGLACFPELPLHPLVYGLGPRRHEARWEEAEVPTWQRVRGGQPRPGPRWRKQQRRREECSIGERGEEAKAAVMGLGPSSAKKEDT